MKASINLESLETTSIITAKKILAEVMQYRRFHKTEDLCTHSNCEKCSSIHLPKIIASIELQEPVTFVLPAFPGKSPNPEKVLGPLPDQAERLSLKFLSDLCKKLQQSYAPGVKIILCSDGRVFSDVVGMKEEDVTAYQLELDRLIEEMNLTELSTFNLDDHAPTQNFIQMREELMENFGESLEAIQNKVRNGALAMSSAEEQEASRLYRGITRFLFEDALHKGQTKSKTTVQKDARARAYEVMRRSNAWSELIAEKFPDAVRLSIHPQGCGSKKLGIRLIGNENWMTPWHGVAVKTKDSYVLLKRFEAEAMKAELIMDQEGRPSHYRLDEEQHLIERRL